MELRIGDLVRRKGWHLSSREMVTNIYKDKLGRDRITTRILSCNNVSPNNMSSSFIRAPYYLSPTITNRVKAALRPGRSFKLRGQTFIALPRRDIPELVAKILVLDRLVDKPVALGLVLERKNMSYSRYHQKSREKGVTPLNSTTFVYKVLKPLKEYNSRWW